MTTDVKKTKQTHNYNTLYVFMIVHDPSLPNGSNSELYLLSLGGSNPTSGTTTVPTTGFSPS